MSAEEVKRIIDNIPTSDIPEARKMAIKRLADNVLSQFSGPEDLRDKFQLFLGLLSEVQ